MYIFNIFLLLRLILERFNVIIPVFLNISNNFIIPTSSPTTTTNINNINNSTNINIKNNDNNSSSTSHKLPTKTITSNLTRTLSESVLYTKTKTTTTTPNKYSNHINHKLLLPSSSSDDDDDNYDNHCYLIPSILPIYQNETITVLSEFITLERVFNFHRFTPPGIIQVLFAKIVSSTATKPISSQGILYNLPIDRTYNAVT